MLMKRRMALMCSAVVLAAWVLPASAADVRPEKSARLSPETFTRFRQVIRTDYEFKWRCLPWEINPAEAALKAAQEGKPVLTFGGHDGVPLGFE
jgi:hypothetical protein